ncbi:SRPBCC family protein [Mycolicibacterium septicum DSM 44393]|uniref:SRPBCC family protein n=1 Tax=Mycolicibacterium septicum DSM 44393 TaxID=1341646 RepID=A0A7X6MQ62_9MYCO|nr:SRPBCC family protein [Mycolicibacterium septicum]NKZ10829.1 SRPBCC family protein [Mycolicibacterium septicum DSM 44393]
MARHTQETVINAPRHIVYDVFADRESSGEYLPFRTTLIRPGNTERQGVGAVHHISSGPFGIREEIVDLVPGERIQYRVVGGLPVRSHVGTITFTDHPQGTAVVYVMDSIPRVRVPASLVVRILRKTTSTIIEGAREESIRRAARATG